MTYKQLPLQSYSVPRNSATGCARLNPCSCVRFACQAHTILNSLAEQMVNEGPVLGALIRKLSGKRVAQALRLGTLRLFLGTLCFPEFAECGLVELALQHWPHQLQVEKELSGAGVHESFLAPLRRPF